MYAYLLLLTVLNFHLIFNYFNYFIIVEYFNFYMQLLITIDN